LLNRKGSQTNQQGNAPVFAVQTSVGHCKRHVSELDNQNLQNGCRYKNGTKQSIVLNAAKDVDCANWTNDKP